MSKAQEIKYLTEYKERLAEYIDNLPEEEYTAHRTTKASKIDAINIAKEKIINEIKNVDKHIKTL
jgi:hypothetical protein